MRGVDFERKVSKSDSRGSLIWFFYPIIPTQNFVQSRYSDSYFWHATSRVYFKARISPRYCYTNPDSEPQIREIHDPEKPIVDYSSLCGIALKRKKRENAREGENWKFLFIFPPSRALPTPSLALLNPSHVLLPSLPRAPFLPRAYSLNSLFLPLKTIAKQG